jgi:hypothetical protein
MITLNADECVLLEKGIHSHQGCVAPGALGDWEKEIKVVQTLLGLGYLTCVSYGHTGVYEITEEGRQAIKTVLD